MALKVYYGRNQASRSYELKFFRAFASTLSAQFVAEGIDGVLLGHPESKDNPYFKPDALLVTQSRAVIIDFKNFDKARIKLPNAEDFFTAEWKSISRGSETTVLGGSSRNPFVQLKKQSDALTGILSHIGTRTTVQTCVLFQGDVEIVGEVPGRYQAFFAIANGFDYTSVLQDSFNLATDSPILDFERIVARFKVAEFTDYPTIKPENLVAVASMAEASRQKQEAVEAQSKAEETRIRAEELMRIAEKEGQSLEAARAAVEEAAKAAEEAKTKADAVRESFDQKRHNLESKKASAKIWVSILSVVLILAGAAVIAMPILEERRLEQEAALLEDQLAGRVCISTTKAKDFVGEVDVCVEYTVNYVNENNYFVYLSEQRYGDFTALIEKDDWPTSASAIESSLLGRTVQVRGIVYEYEGTPQLRVRDASQVTVVD